MLKTVWLTEKKDLSKGCAMLLGGFDGLHVGHRLLLSRAKASGLPVGIMTIVGGKEDKGLFTFSERESVFSEGGADFVFELPFTEIKDLDHEAFLGLLKREFSPKLFVCGEDFRFGFGAKGTPETIKAWGQVRVETLPLVEKNGEKISSGTVKKLLKNGDVEKANALLGEEFFLIGEVVKDRGIGRTLGFPTANIAYPKDKFPIPKGVYETRVTVDGKEYKGITNFGSRPTYADESVLTETHLDGYGGDLYGRSLKIRFVRFLREIRKFENGEDLKKQLSQDLARVRTEEKEVQK